MSPKIACFGLVLTSMERCSQAVDLMRSAILSKSFLASSELTWPTISPSPRNPSMSARILNGPRHVERSGSPNGSSGGDSVLSF